MSGQQTHFEFQHLGRGRSSVLSTLGEAVSAPEHIQKFEEAMQAANSAEALYDLAISLRDEGMSQTDLCELFRGFQAQTSGEDPRYDAIVDTMDLIYGGPWAKGCALFSTELGHA